MKLTESIALENILTSERVKELIQTHVLGVSVFIYDITLLRVFYPSSYKKGFIYKDLIIDSEWIEIVDSVIINTSIELCLANRESLVDTEYLPSILLQLEEKNIFYQVKNKDMLEMNLIIYLHDMYKALQFIVGYNINFHYNIINYDIDNHLDNILMLNKFFRLVDIDMSKEKLCSLVIEKYFKIPDDMLRRLTR